MSNASQEIAAFKKACAREGVLRVVVFAIVFKIFKVDGVHFLRVSATSGKIVCQLL